MILIPMLTSVLVITPFVVVVGVLFVFRPEVRENNKYFHGGGDVLA